MGMRRFARTSALPCFLLLLVSQLYAYPHRIEETPMGFDVGKSIRAENVGYGASSGRTNEGKAAARIVHSAIDSGELSDLTNWNKPFAFARGIQDQDTQVSATSLKTRTADSDGQQGQKGQQGQRRLFENRNGSSMTETVQSDGKIVFPTDDTMIGAPHQFNSRPAPVCQGKTFCERAAYYPEDLINQAMQLNDTLKYLAGVDVVSEIEQRIDVMDDVPLCVSTEQVVYPKSAENKRKEWLFVVNQDNFKQGIRIETCSNENGECSVIDGLAEGYRTTCKQKYIYRQLAAISSDGKVTPDMFRFPSSCCCHAKFIGNPLTRIGLIGDQRSQTPVSKPRRRK